MDQLTARLGPYQCRVCRAVKVTVSLARSCEERDCRALGVSLEDFLKNL